MAKKRKVVYCDECDHFVGGATKFGNLPYECLAPQNGKPNFKNSRGIKKTPEDINENNDCKWFVPRKPLLKKIIDCISIF